LDLVNLVILNDSIFIKKILSISEIIYKILYMKCLKIIMIKYKNELYELIFVLNFFSKFTIKRFLNKFPMRF
jgi:hypothetical protein